MRMNPLGHIALLVLALSAFAQSALASERFMCADGTFVEVTSQNRAEQYQHPCVRAWFERRADRTRNPEPKTDVARPQASLTTGSGAVLPAAAAATAVASARPVIVSVSGDAKSTQAAKDAPGDGNVRSVRAGRRR